MNTQKKVFRKRGIIFLLIGLTIFILYLFFFVGISEIAQIIQRINPFHYSLAIIAFFLSAAFYTLTWQFLLGQLQIKSAFPKAFSLVFVSSFIDLLIPAESFTGEITKIYLMSKNTGGDMGKVAASVVSHRILVIATTLIGIIIGSTFVFFGYKTSQLVVNLMLFVATCTIVALIMMIYLSLNPKATRRITDWAVRLISFISKGRWEPIKFKRELEEGLDAFHQGMQLLKKQSTGLIFPFIFSVIAFLIDLLMSFFVFMSLGYPVSINMVLVVSTIVNAIQTIPLGIVGEIGITDVAMTSLYIGLGISGAVSAASTVLTRFLTVWFRIFVGYMVFQWMGIRILLSPRTSRSS